MDGLDPFLANFNPLLRWLDYQAPVVGDFLSNPSSSTADFLPYQSGQNAPLHLSRQMTIFTPESLSIHQSRLASNRGNGYLQPFAIGSFYPSTQAEIFPSHDCNNTFGGQPVTHNPPSSPPQEESGQFPFSSLENPNVPQMVGSNFPGFPINPPGPSAYAACTIAPDFPSIFGGSNVPVVTRDP
jgi:hypothetical protein